MSSAEVSRGLGIRGRLTLLTGLLALAMVLIGGAAVFAMKQLHAASQALANEWMPRIAASTDMTSALSTLRSVQYAHILVIATGDKKPLEAAADALIAQIDALRAQSARLPMDEQERVISAKFDKNWAAYKLKGEEIRVVSRAGDADVAAQLMMSGLSALNLAAQGDESVKPLDSAALFRLLSDEVKDLLKLHRTGGERARLQAQQTYERTVAALGVAVAVAVTLSIALAVWIARGITRPVTSAMSVLRSVADGDLTAGSKIQASGELAELLDSLDDTRLGLTRVVESVRESTAAVTSSSNELARGNLDLSNRTERQSNSIQETASAIAELSTSLEKNADASHSAHKLAEAASTAAEAGGEAVGKLVGTMADISSRSNEIVDIVTVIDGIAFQTNILALNASVEAARAGEQGRGFAVVASEVRALSIRSADAAKQVRTLVKGSVERIEAGASMANAARVTVNDIVTRIREVSQTVQRISTATDDGARGVSRINESIAQMNTITRENVALVEEGAAAADLLKEQAERLSSSVSVFRLS